MLQKFLGDSGLDIAVLIGVARYVGIGVWNAYLDYKASKDGDKREVIYNVINTAINWVYVNIVQAKKKLSQNGLTLSEGKEALNAAVAKAIELGNKQGVDLTKEVADIPSAVQEAFDALRARR